MTQSRGNRRVSYRPGFSPRGQSSGVPVWLLALSVILVLLVGGTAFYYIVGNPQGKDTEVTPTAATTTVPSAVPPTVTHTPSPTPTPVTQACIAIQDTLIYKEPTINSVSQYLNQGRTVNVIDQVQGDGYTWHRVFLPGYTEILYVRVEAVECP